MHLPHQQPIDFLTIDVEGLDLEVLKSNDWMKYRPAVVLVEDGEHGPFERVDASEIMKFMTAIGYHFCAKTLLTTFFIEPAKIEITAMGPRLRSDPC